MIGASVDDVLSSNLELFGGVEEVAETLRERRGRFGISYVVVPDHAYEAFAPVVARLAGT